MGKSYASQYANFGSLRISRKILINGYLSLNLMKFK